MVAVTVDEFTIGEGSQRSTLVSALRIGQKRLLEYVSKISVTVMIDDPETAFRSMCKGMVYQIIMMV